MGKRRARSPNSSSNSRLLPKALDVSPPTSAVPIPQTGREWAARQAGFMGPPDVIFPALRETEHGFGHRVVLGTRRRPRTPSCGLANQGIHSIFVAQLRVEPLECSHPPRTLNSHQSAAVEKGNHPFHVERFPGFFCTHLWPFHKR